MEALILSVSLPQSQFFELEEDLGELKELARTAGFKIAASDIVSTSKIFSGTFISKPTAEAAAIGFSSYEAKTLIFSEDLSPTQLRNLEKIFDKMVIDRTELILQIFQSNARTEEARIQVEMAQLKYTLPRLKRMWPHLSRIEGGYSFTKGPGETQIEMDRRAIKNRISLLAKKLKDISTQRETRRKKRVGSDLPMVSLVGYTNAGKTTLLNKLAKEKLLAENKLFATLSPVTRKAYLKEGSYALISDTVGFIKNLPPHLIASFHSTLQEIEYSDMIAVVQDISHPNFESQLDSVRSILGELNSLDKPKIQIFTKIDLLKNKETLENLKKYYPGAVFVSSLTEEGLLELKEKIAHAASKLGRRNKPF